MRRVLIYIVLPVAFVLSLMFLQQGTPMTFKCDYQVSTLEPGAMGTADNGQPKQQTIVTGPEAATVPMEQLGTNGGGFFGMNFAHPYQSPTAFTNLLGCFAMMLFPFSLVLMYGRMLKRVRHSVVIFSVMMVLLVGTVVWAIYFDTLKPNPGITAHPAGQTYQVPSATAPGGKRQVTIPAVAGLPVDQHLGNLEGKELRFGTSAGATWAALTVDVTCGAINCEHDSLNPIAALSPMVGMWLNCIFGGKGVGVINRHATEFLPVGQNTAGDVGRWAALASVPDETPEGKTIVSKAKELTTSAQTTLLSVPDGAEFVPFTAQTRMSGVDLPDGRKIRKGASDAIVKFVRARNGNVPAELDQVVKSIASKGATPLVVAEDTQIVGVVVLEDVLKPAMSERFERLRRMGLRTVMITGDNPLTAATIAKKAGVDDFLAQAKPEDKLAYIRKEQAEGKLVAMMGDGTNDAPALAQADVALAMNAGTQAAKEAANMVDLDSDPTKLIEVVEIGKQLLMTRGALTTFSIANDVAKYFAIIPALFAGTLPWLKNRHYAPAFPDFSYSFSCHF